MLSHNSKLHRSQHCKEISNQKKLYLSQHDIFRECKTRKNTYSKKQAKSEIGFESAWKINQQTIKNSQSGTKLTFQTKTPKRYDTDSTFINNTNEFANSVIENILKNDKAKSEQVIENLKKQKQQLQIQIEMLQQQNLTQAKESKKMISQLQSNHQITYHIIQQDALTKEKIRNHLLSTQKEEQKKEMIIYENILGKLGNDIINFMSMLQQSLLQNQSQIQTLKDSLMMKIDQYQTIKQTKIKLNPLPIPQLQQIFQQLDQQISLKLSRIQPNQSTSQNVSLIDQFNTFLEESDSEINFQCKKDLFNIIQHEKQDDEQRNFQIFFKRRNV